MLSAASVHGGHAVRRYHSRWACCPPLAFTFAPAAGRCTTESGDASRLSAVLTSGPTPWGLDNFAALTDQRPPSGAGTQSCGDYMVQGHSTHLPLCLRRWSRNSSHSSSKQAAGHYTPLLAMAEWTPSSPPDSGEGCRVLGIPDHHHQPEALQ